MSFRISLGGPWKFHLGDERDADYRGYDDRAWRTVTVPHDWSVEQPFDRKYSSGTGYLAGGTAWYRKHFDLPGELEGKKIILRFDGVYQHAKVFVNSHYLGSHAYGYTAFSFEISDFLKPENNVICVRVEHEETADSRWFTGSGIYREVFLEVSDRVSFQENGLFVSTVRADQNEACLNIEYETDGADAAEFLLRDPEGNECLLAKAETGNGKTEACIPHPKLWSPDRPALYTFTARAFFMGELRDERKMKIGIRTFRFDPQKGFFLNGNQMKIKGVCTHHDGGALGAAVPRTVWEKRFSKWKEAGANAVRTAHNPPSEEFLDLCDEMGLLVMDEAFDEWEGTKNKWWQGHNVYPPKHYGYAEDFPLWHKADLQSMVLRDRNHPSVILWSIGNEIDYPNDPYVSPLFSEVFGNNDAGKPAQERQYDENKPDASRLPVLAKELTETVHALDETRPVLSALAFPELSTRTGFAQVLDVVGYNYKEAFYDLHHEQFPEMILFGSENSHSPEAWHAVTDREFISGQFVWTGVDFLGECRGWPLRISEAGLLDLCGNEKPVFYQTKALWTTAPFVKITVREDESDWRGSLLLSEKEGEGKELVCYTNQKSVKLYRNGELVGEKEGGRENGYKAVFPLSGSGGIFQAETEGAEDVLQAGGELRKIRLEPEKRSLASDGRDVLRIEVTLTDENGTAVGSDEEIRYQLLGDAEIIGIENGRPDDLTPYSEKRRKTRDGRATVYVRAGTVPGEIRMVACNADRTVSALAVIYSENESKSC